MSATDGLRVERNEAQKRFEVKQGEMTAYIDYIAMAKKIIFTHTEVPPPLEGEGIGSLLARHVMEYARENDLKVIPLCPFLGSWLRRHHEYQHLVVPGMKV